MALVDAAGNRYYLPVTPTNPQTTNTNTPPTPQQTQQFVNQAAQTSLTDAQNASQAYETAAQNGASNADQLYQDMVKKWGTYMFWAEEQLRIAKLSGGQTAVDNQLSNIKANFKGDDYASGVLTKVLNQAKSDVLGETTEHTTTEIALINTQQTQQALTTALQDQANLSKIPANIRNANPEIDQQANQAVTQAQQDFVSSLNALHDDLVKELGLPANFTDQQLTDALKKLKDSHQGEGLDAIIDGIGAELKIKRNLDNINPNDPSLSPVEKQLAQSDPNALAFIQAAGISLNPKDYNTTDPNSPDYLSPQELQLMNKNPMMFALMRLAHISIRTSADGMGIQAFINGKPAQNLNADQLNAAKGGDVQGLVASLVQQVQWDPNIKTLMEGSDTVRLNYATAKMKELMSGSNPDLQKALQFLSTNLNGMFSQDSRAALWQQAGLPYFNEQWVSGQIDKLLTKPDPLSNNPQDRAALQSTELNADKVGRWMQRILKNAPPELANIILDAVESKFSKDWYDSNQVDTSGLMPRFEEFYKGLSMAVQLAPNRAQEVANWLLDKSGPQSSVIYQLHGTGMGIGFQSVRETVANGYGTALSEALLKSLTSSKDFPQNMDYEFNLMLTQGEQKLVNDYVLNINRENYLNFMNDPKKVLNPFFDHYLQDPKIGTPQKITNDTELYDLIGQALGLTPSDQTAASAGDFSKAWYKPGTTEWNIIQLVAQWIYKEGGKNPTVTVLPFVYASQKAGVHNGALFQITKPDGSQEVIDGSAAMDAVQTSQNGTVDPNNVNFQWHYSNFQDFQDNNQYDDSGFIYLPTNFRIGDNNSDGHVDYTRYAAHHTTWQERVKQGLGIAAMVVGAAGAVLLAIPSGGTSLALAGIVLAGAGTVGGIALSADHLYDIGSHGESVSWNNPDAQSDWLNIIGSSAALLTIGSGMALRLQGLGKFAPWINGINKVSGFVSTGVGFRQAGGQAMNLLQNWDQMTTDQRIQGLAFLGVGIGQFAIGGIKFRPGQSSAVSPASFETLVQERAYQIWEDNAVQANYSQAREALISERAGQIWLDNGGQPVGQVESEANWFQAIGELEQLPNFQDLIKQRALQIALGQPEAPGVAEANWLQAKQDIWDPIIKANAAQLALDDPASAPADNEFQAKQEIQNLIALRFRALWRAAGRPSGQDDAFWVQAENDIFQQGGKPLAPTLSTATSRQNFIEESAYYLSEDDPARSATTNYLQALGEINDAITLRARELWREAGRPSGQDLNFWLQAENQIFGEAPKAGKVLQWLNNLNNGWKMRPKDTSDPAAKTFEFRFSQYRNQAKGYFKVLGTLYLGSNILGAIGAGAYYFGFQAQRKTSAITSNNAYTELQNLQTNPDKYLQKNYDNAFFGADIPGLNNMPFNSNGHLMEIAPGSSPFYNYTKDPYYFRRVPQDLYDALLHSNDPRISHSHTFTDANGNKTTLNGVFVTEQIKDASGKWVDITVEIRPPYSGEPFRDAGYAQFFADPGLDGKAGRGIFGLPGFRWRPELAIGPIEGFRVHADLEVLFDYRYSTPTATTLRLGLPSLTQGWGLGIRQQNTSLWSRLNLSVNAIDINAAKVADLTDPNAALSGTEFTAMNARFYWDLGNRDRFRIDFNGKDYSGSLNGQPTLTPAAYYSRVRETFFSELGLGADFLKWTFANGSSINLNGYYEFQYYAPDFRSQLNFGGGTITRTQGFQPIPPLFEIDPALQITVSGDVPWANLGDRIPRLIPPLPGLTAPKP